MIGPDNAENVLAPLDSHLGRRIRARRSVLMLSQEALAQLMAIPVETLSRIEMGLTRLAPSQLHGLSTILDVPLSYFFDKMPRELDADFPGTPFADPGQWGGEPEDMRETLELLRAYLAISDEADRQRVQDLALALANATET